MAPKTILDGSDAEWVKDPRYATLARMSLEPDRNEERESVAGNPFDEELVGPSSGSW